MKNCQKKFLFNRKYNELENCVEYICEEKQYAIKVEAPNQDIELLDKKCLDAISLHCKQMCQHYHKTCI